jgi:uncharacterized protein (TIGR03435 family)
MNMNALIRPLIAAGWMALALPSSLGQTRATTTPATSLFATAPYVPTMTFDVASVRETGADKNGGITVFVQFAPNTTHLRMSLSIDFLLSIAYGLDSYQLVGLPKWQNPTVFTIEAKGDSEADAKMAALPAEEQKMEQQHMLQALLEDRFKLKTHWEMKEGDTYNLVVAKGGPKLGAEGSALPSADELKTFGDRPVPVLHQVGYGGNPAWIAHGCSIDQWAKLLTSMFGRPVVDKTGLKGKYDFVLRYKGRSDQDRSSDDVDPTPPLDRALQNELGLKIEPAKGPTKLLIIDHIEHPSNN